jgi:dienelactone hydrolase
MNRIAIAIAALVLAAAPARAAIKSEVIEYKHGDVVLEGFMCWDDAAGKRPGVLVAHEWKGHDEYVRGRAAQLAQLGYTAFALDMYGKGVHAKDHEEAAKLSGAIRADRKLMRERAAAGLDVLRKHPACDPTKIAAIGYCFGGSAVLELARSGADLTAVVTFHGALDTPMPAKAGELKAKVLVFHGAEDKFVKPEAVAAFKDEMRAAKADWTFVELSGAVHSFTVKAAGDDPSKGMAYNETADKRSWELMKVFFTETLR